MRIVTKGHASVQALQTPSRILLDYLSQAAVDVNYGDVKKICLQFSIFTGLHGTIKVQLLANR